MISTYTSLNFDLGETNDILRDHVNQFAANEVAPLAESTDQDNEFPNKLWKKMGDMGLLGITCDEKYGGAGMGYLAHSIAMEEISRASALPTYIPVLSNNTKICCYRLRYTTNNWS